jgi:hypothetical protein
MELLKSREDVVYFGLAVATNVIVPISEVWFDVIGGVAETIYKSIAGTNVNPATAARAAAIAVMAANIPLTYIGLKIYQESEGFGKYIGAVMMVAAVFSTWTGIQVLFANDLKAVAKKLGLEGF